MFRFLGLGTYRVLEPGLKEGVGHIGGGVVVSFYLIFYDRGWDIDEETWLGGAGAAEKYFWRFGVVPCCGFYDCSGACFRACEIGADIMEAL